MTFPQTFTAIAMLLFSPLVAEASAAKPNIVFVLFDDMGYGQPGCYNAATELRTPHLDRLAEQGMRFTDAHSASAVCTPTRYGVLTGRYPFRIGQFGVLTSFSKPLIPPTRQTVPSFLQQNGYATACIGKWHLGMDWVEKKPGKEDKLRLGAKMTGGPIALGFDQFYGFTHARNIGSLIEQDEVVAHVKAVENQPLMIRKAVEWIDGRAGSDKPFFLYFPMCPPHTPVVPAPEYAGKSGARDAVGKDPEYGDWVYQGDAMLGQLLEALERNGMAKNTLVIATSDNGAERRAYAPLRDSKRSVYEGGHRVPFVVRWPGKVKPGSVNGETICLNDLMATASDIVRVPLVAGAAEDSFSLLPTLLGEENPAPREAVIHQSMAGDLAIRKGPWKLVIHKKGKRELYHLESDIGEKSDVLSSNAELAGNLEELLQSLIERGRSTPGPPLENDYQHTLPNQVR